MSEESKKKTALEKIKSIKHIEIIIAVVAVIAMLIIYFSTIGASGTAKKNTATAEQNYCDAMQTRLETLISAMEGAGKAQVLISWESGVQSVLAENSSSSTSSTTSSPLIIGGSPVTIKEIYPKAIGVLIICQGGNNAKVKVNIMMAITALLEIPQDKIIVYAMAK